MSTRDTRATITAALVIGSYGRTAVKPETWHGLTEIWEQLAFWANSLIFVLAGLLVPTVMAGFTVKEFVLLAIIVVTAFAARALIVYGILPMLAGLGLGEKVSLGYKTVMVWGGLRGAVSLALALAIYENTEIKDDEVKNFIMVLVTGFVLFTLFINAPTMGWLLRAFGLDKLSPAEQAIRDRVTHRSLTDVKDRIEGLATELRVVDEAAKEVAGGYDSRLAEAQSGLAKVESFPEEDRVKMGIKTLINHERRLYHQQYNQGLVSPRTARYLFGRADDLADAVKANGLDGYEETITKQLEFSRDFRISMALQRRISYSGFLAEKLADRFETILITQTVLRELIDYNEERIGELLGDSVSDSLARILDRRLKRTSEQLDAMKLQYPEYASTLQTRLLERVALRLEDGSYRALLEQSVISTDVFKHVQVGLQERKSALEKRPHLDLGLEPEKLVAKVPFFADLDPVRIGAIANLLKPRLVLPDERVVTKGEAGDAVYFISTGAVSVDLEPEPVRLGSGEFFGEIALLTDQPRVATVTAISYCQVLALYTKDLLDAHADLRERITRVAEERLAADNLAPMTPGQG